MQKNYLLNLILFEEMLLLVPVSCSILMAKVASFRREYMDGGLKFGKILSPISEHNAVQSKSQ